MAGEDDRRRFRVFEGDKELERGDDRRQRGGGGRQRRGSRRRGGDGTAAELPSGVTCPFCGGRDTRPLTPYGSLLMTAQYACDACRTTFEWVREEEG